MVAPQVPTEDWVACKTCGQIYLLDSLPEDCIAKCQRCGSTVARRSKASVQSTAAFALTALILYIPANIFPILRMNMYGATTENTVWEGCVRLYRGGDAVVAGVVFLASMLIPFLKLLGLFFLVMTTYFKFSGARKFRTWIYQAIEKIGRWAMLDVFVLAVLVSLVKLKRLATVLPGSGLIAFSGVVVFTLLASASFDSERIWNSTKLDR
jgi:paraquat-inducible protein A